MGTPAPITPEDDAALAELGAGAIAFLRPLDSGDAAKLYPEFPEVAAVDPGIQVFVLCDAAGSPMVLYGDREAALAEASEHGFVVVNVH
jgi:hypothetical protein